MIDFKYIQNNLPCSKTQLELFKYELDFYEGYKFNFVTGIHLITQEYSVLIDPNEPYPPIDSYKQHWFNYCTDGVFINLADKVQFECVKRRIKEVNILLTDSYLLPFVENEEVKILEARL